jgi:hypothetical protein
MTMFEVSDIRKVIAEITSKLDACDHGEGIECATLDQALGRYAQSCREFLTCVRTWAQNVFSGKLPYDPQAERQWREEGVQLYHRAFAMWQRGTSQEVLCYDLPGHEKLQAALYDFYRLLTEWVSPKLSVGPSARNQVAVDVGAVRERMAALPPLPANWEPDDQMQRSIYRKVKTS